MVMPTPKAAAQTLRAIARGRRERIITGHGKFFVAFDRFAPWLLRALTARMAAIRTKDDTRKWE
jgi:hypothetical protein